MRQSPPEWLNSELDALGQIAVPPMADRGSAFPAQPWTFLKLIVLRAYIQRVYLPILRDRYSRLVFVDLFAGSGVCRYLNEGFDELIPGSAAIGASFRTGTADTPRPGFDALVLVEKDPSRLRAACSVVNQFGFGADGTLSPIESDANDAVDDVVSQLRVPRTHALVFADSDRLEPAFETLRRIINAHDGTDLFVTHLNAGSARGATSSGNSDSRDRFYGTNEWGENGTRDELSELYRRQLLTLRENVDVLHIRGGAGTGGYGYDLLFGVRETAGQSPFRKFITSVREKLDRLDGDAVAHCLRTRYRTSGVSRPVQRRFTEGQ